MDFMVNIEINKPGSQINYHDPIMLMGSCFTEHIGNSLEDLKFSVLQNPNGILFDPDSVCRSLRSYIDNKKYSEADFFQLNDVWHSWEHHSRYSNTNIEEAVHNVNESQQEAHEFLKKTKWLIITLGSSFSYRLSKLAQTSKVSSPGRGLEGAPVANCHRAPAQWFDKHLINVEEIVHGFENCLKKLFQFNPNINIIFTISPVRHIRDGVIEQRNLITPIISLLMNW
jgi:hypothetical protein